MDRPSISQLKAELQQLGLNTQTPGLTGEERFEELNGRLLDAQSKLNNKLSRPAKSTNIHEGADEDVKVEKGGSKQLGGTVKKDKFVMPSLQDLSITEIRSRLTSLGESTNTPGLTGEERRDELMRRLVGAICGTEDADTNDMFEEIVADEEKGQRNAAEGEVEDIMEKPPKYVPPPPPRRPPGAPPRPRSPAQEKPQQRAEESSGDEEDLVVISQSEISEMKKSLKRMSNKRAMTIAARLSGSGQDPVLKEYEKMANQAEAEIARLNFQKQRSKAPSSEKASSLLLESTKTMSVDKLLVMLENMRANAKEDVKQARLRVREECEADESYGVAAEQALSKQIGDAVLLMGRTRRKVDELKMKAVKDKKKKKEDKEKREKEGANTGTVRTAPGRKGPSTPLETPLDSFDARMNRMEAENDRAMSGLDDLLQEMEEEEGLLESIRKEQEDGDDGLPATNPGSAGKNKGKDSNRVKTPPAKTKVIVSVGGPPGSRDKPRVRASPKSSPTATVAQGSPPSPSSRGSSHGGSHRGTRASPGAPSSPKAQGPLSPRESPAGSPKGAESASAAAAAAAEISFRLGGPGPRRPEGTPPPGAILKPGPGSGRILAGNAGVAQPQPEHPWELPADLGAPTASQQSGLALRTGKHFDEDEDEDEDGDDNKGGRSRAPDTGEAAVASLIRSRASTPGTSRRAEADDGDDEDEEMEALLRKYPKQRERDEDGDEVSDPEDEEVVLSRRELIKRGKEASRPRSVGFAADPSPVTVEEGGGKAKEKEKAEDKEERPRSVGFVDFEAPSDFASSFTSPRPPSGDTEEGKDEKEEEEKTSASAGSAEGSRPTTSTSFSSEEEEGDDLNDRPLVRRTPSPVKAKPALKGSFASRISALTTSSPGDDRADNDDVALRQQEEQRRRQDAEEEADEKDDNDSSLDEAAEDAKQIVVLRKHARVLDRLNDIPQTENVFARCLEIDPMDVKTLQGYAVFLHTRKGELARAEAFFLRAIHICLPDFVDSLQGTGSPSKDKGEGESENVREDNKLSAPGSPPKRPPGKPVAPKPSSLRVHTVTRLLLKFANFVKSAKGDVDTATTVFRKAVTLAPSDSEVLASFAHFLAQEGDRKSYREALELFSKALKLSPDNAAYALQYARLLKKTRNTSQADLMYQVAVRKSKGYKKLEPAAICNYATFTCRQRRNPSLAYRMFISGLDKFPDHKGLLKNFELLVKSNPDVGSPSALQAAKEKRVHTPSSKSKVRRALAMANSQSDLLEGDSGTNDSPAHFIDSPRTLEEYQASAAAVSKISPMVGASASPKPSSPSFRGIEKGRPQLGGPPALLEPVSSASKRLGSAAQNLGDFFSVDEDAEAGVYRDDESSEDDEDEDEDGDEDEEEESDEELYAAP